MTSIAHPRKILLTPEERETVAVYNDASRTWTIYSDSRIMRVVLLRLARQLGAALQRVGDHGIEFEVPAKALRLAAKRLPGGRGRPFALQKPASPAVAEGKVPILDGPLAGA